MSRFTLSFVIMIHLSQSLLAKEILIFSDSHNNQGVSKLTERQGLLSVEVSSMSPIQSVVINGQTQSPQETTYGHFILPFEIAADRVVILVSVETEKEKSSKTYVLEYQDPEQVAKKKNQWQNIFIAKTESNNNINLVNENPIKGTKRMLTWIPRYQVQVNQEVSWIFQAILLREKYRNPANAAYEIAFSQLKAGQKRTLWGESLRLSLGLNDIATETQKLSGANPVEKDLFLETQLSSAAGQPNTWDLRWQATKKKAPAPLLASYDSSGINHTWAATYGFKLGRWSNNLGLEAQKNDALGAYQDWNSAQFSVQISYPFSSSLQCSFKGSYKSTGFLISDPVKQGQEKSRLKIGSLGMDYNLFSSLILQLEGRLQTQSSNLKAKNYKAKKASFSVLTIF